MGGDTGDAVQGRKPCGHAAVPGVNAEQKDADARRHGPAPTVHSAMLQLVTVGVGADEVGVWVSEAVGACDWGASVATAVQSVYAARHDVVPVS